MNENTSRPLTPRPAGQNTADRVVLFGFAFALPATPLLPLLGAGSEVLALLWIAAVIWATAASLVQALAHGIRHGDWSAFMCAEIPRNEDDFDWATKSGQFAYRKIREINEALYDDAHLFHQPSDPTGHFE